ncbi:MAG: chloride channel protein [Bacteroidetes bacterium GWE2_42_24]|nr:MAG: chloride channel protein [Bacteroidetes bacterium GWE2_42_24]OFY32261.1 MAG: chloride channel protein [Bacteroidetes bacterium GWF2_43_11]HCU20672.1 chloride channel protein [Bacteroidales bacterium]
MINGSQMFAVLLRWRIRNVSEQQFVYIVSFIVGILSGLAAVLLKNTLYYTHYLLSDGFNYAAKNYLYFASPLVGIVLTVLFVRYFVRDSISHGVSRILFAISKNNSLIKAHNTYSSIIASTLTIAFGGSVGAEAPVVLTGSAIGSNIARIFRLDYKMVTIMVGCGAAGAIAGIFKAPIAGLVFALEVLMIDLSIATIMPLLISAVTASVVAYFLLGEGVLFSFRIEEHFVLTNIPWYILLGIVCGFISLYFTRVSMAIEVRVKKIKPWWLKPLAGGIVLGGLIFIFPSLFGEGYEVLHAMVNGRGEEVIEQSVFGFATDNEWMLIGVLGLMMAFKVVAMAVTNSAGGVGGVFAPTLFMGGVAGFFTSRLLNATFNIGVSDAKFALVGMAGLMAGVMHAPLTAIFLIAEITGGYQLLTPLMITSTISFLTIHYFEPYSIYTKMLAQRGELITHHKDKAVLLRMKVSDLLETNFCTVSMDMTLGQFVQIVSKSERNIFPVVDSDNTYLGVVFLNDIRHMLFDHSLYNEITVRQLMFMPDVSVSPDDSMEDVASVFQQTAHYNLPVIKDGKYVGFVSRANVFSRYRRLLKDSSDE